jgi:hypothetical protein
MAQSEAGSGISIAPRELIVELQYIPGWIERTRRVLMHGQVRHGLVCKEGGSAIEAGKTRDA